MAARLTVVISQSATRDSRAAEVEERLLAELMMTAGLDTTLIGALEYVQPDSTDYLCLTGFTQSIAFASWLPIEDARQHWQRLGLDGEIVAIGDVMQTTNAARRVTYFSLQSPAEQIVSQLKRLLADRSIQTVSLNLPSNGKKQSDRPSNGKLSEGNAGKETESRSKVAEQGRGVPLPSRPAATPVPPPPQPSPPAKVADEATVDEWPDLDRLVDDFDALDL